jgi:flagellar biosynthesis chaperone FliJ
VAPSAPAAASRAVTGSVDRAAMESRLKAIDADLLKLSEEREQIRVKTRESLKMLHDVSAPGAESSDPEIKKMRDRLQELEKERFELQQELKKRLGAQPEVKRVMELQQQATSRMQELETKRRELIREKWQVENSLNALKGGGPPAAVKPIAMPPAAPAGARPAPMPASTPAPAATNAAAKGK